MPDYTNGKIYTIRHPDSEKYYIGSTCQPIHKRFNGHKTKYINNILNPTSKILFELGVNDCYIELLENYPCNNKEELNKREGELIRLYKNNLVNKQIAGRTKEEYEIDNKDKMDNYRKEYYIENKSIITQKQKEYNSINAININKRVKQWREENKDKVKIRNETIEKCKCGYEYTLVNKARHEKSKRHLGS